MRHRDPYSPKPDEAAVYYDAFVSRDPRFDGRFFTGVVTTGIYCRPTCPARKPGRRNCRFFRSAAEAQRHGFRPCRRCRPETAPDSPAWLGTAATVKRGLDLIMAGALEEGSVDDLAGRLGVTARHLRRLFHEHVGVSPHRYARTHRLNVASQLLRHSDMPVTEVAFAAGFHSTRRFNSAFRDVYSMSPRQYRGAPATEASPTTPALSAHRAPLVLELGYREPYDWGGTIEFLARRAVPGLETVEADGYTRTFILDQEQGLVRVRRSDRRRVLRVEILTTGRVRILSVIERVRATFDLDADPVPIAETLCREPGLSFVLERWPGLRVPGGWDLFELGVRAILGQQVSVAGARTLTGRLVEELGDPTRLPEAQTASCAFHFPRPRALMEAELESIGLPKSRADAIRHFAKFMHERGDGAYVDPLAFETSLRALPGIGPWTAHYVRMRGLKDPDAFPAHDAALRRAAGELGLATDDRQLQAVSERWRPWRSYATVALWRSLALPARAPATKPFTTPEERTP